MMHMTKRELQDLYWIKKHIQRMKEKLEELRAQAEKYSRSFDGQPSVDHAQFSDRTGDLVAKIVDLEQCINEKLERMYELEARVERAIETLPKREAYLIRLRYIQGMEWMEICSEMNYSWRQVHRIHAEALQLLA